MSKRNVKTEIKKPDIVIRSVGLAYRFVVSNLRLCIAVVAGCIVVVLAGYGYSLYAKSQDDKIQVALSEGMRSFEEYAVSGKTDSLDKADKMFTEITANSQGSIRGIARLYLARIRYTQGKKDEALALYKKALTDSTDPILKTLAETAVAQLDKK